MTTVIFIHGTGVREREYGETFKIIEQKIHAQRPDIHVARCLWGEDLGTKLNADGASIPLPDATLALDQTEAEDPEIILWQQLYSDPLYELRLLSLKPIAVGNPFGEQPGDILHSRLASLTLTAKLQAKLEAAGIAAVFEQGREDVIRSQAYEQILPRVSEADVSEYHAAIARAIVAQTMQICEQQQKFPPILTDAQLRDEVVDLLTLALGEAELGLVGWLLQPLLKLGTNYVKGNRLGITEKVSPIPADILLYQTRGKGIRQFIKQQIAQAEPPVVLLAHSLGGIASVDLLVEQPHPQVELLVTVGSQAPFLYEINALSSLEFGQPLPEHFPEWLNVYDLRDFLSYLGSKIFPGVQDVRVDSKQPFPRSHAAYWTNNDTWKAVIPRLP